MFKQLCFCFMLFNVSQTQIVKMTIPGHIFAKIEKDGPIDFDEYDEPRTIHLIVKNDSYEVLPRNDVEMKKRAVYYLALPFTKTTQMGRIQAQQLIC